MGKQNDTDILRAEDIIPSSNQKKSEQSSNTETVSQKTSEIPEFDLAKQIMAEKRKNASTKRKAPKAAGKKTSTEYNGVQNVIERAFLTHQKKQSTVQTSERKPDIPEKDQINDLGLESCVWRLESYSDTNETQKIISEIVAKDIQKLISRI